MRRTVAASLALSLLLPAAATAGRIFGDITIDGAPAPAGVRLEISLVPPANDSLSARIADVADSTSTDEFGSYKLTVPEEGKCVLTLLYEGHAPTFEVFSYKRAVRYDLVIERTDGTVRLRRK